MLSKKRAILFDVLGRASQQARIPWTWTFKSRCGRCAQRPPRPSRPQRPAPSIEAGAGSQGGQASAKAPRTRREWAWSSIPAPVLRWTAISSVFLVVVGFAIWKGHGPAKGGAPALQTNVGDGGGEAARGPEVEPAYTYSVCALEASYKTPTERKLARQRVEELVRVPRLSSQPGFFRRARTGRAFGQGARVRDLQDLRRIVGEPPAAVPHQGQARGALLEGRSPSLPRRIRQDDRARGRIAGCRGFI